MLLAPIIAGGLLAFVGIGLLLYGHFNRPQLVTSRPEEEAQGPFKVTQEVSAAGIHRGIEVTIGELDPHSIRVDPNFTREHA